MTIYNPNRLVTGLSDISYVKQVNRIQAAQRADQVVIDAPPAKPLVVQGTDVIEDRFVPDLFTPATMPDNGGPEL